MITIYYLTGGKIAEMDFKPGMVIPDEPVWIDLLDPTPEEERALPQELNIALPKADDLWRNHALNRMQVKDGNLYMNAAVIHNVKSGTPESSPINFILTPEFLITIRRIDPKAFLQMQERVLLNPKTFQKADMILADLLEAIIERIAEKHEQVIKGLADISHRIFVEQAIEGHRADPTAVMREILKKLGFLADLNAKINETLHSILRLLVYVQDHYSDASVALKREFERLTLDCKSLSEQTGFMNNKINFQLDTTLGMVNVEQNLISKAFSVVALVFLPPTLVAGIYGMNFQHMPELSWPFGYGFALLLMGVCAVVPYLLFKRRGWL